MKNRFSTHLTMKRLTTLFLSSRWLRALIPILIGLTATSLYFGLLATQAHANLKIRGHGESHVKMTKSHFGPNSGLDFAQPRAVSQLTAQSDDDLEFPPAIYYGWITPTLSFTPTVGMSVTARIDGNICGQTTIGEWNGRLVYKMQVTGEKVSAPPNGCGESGKNILFEVGNWVMAHDHLWENSQAWFHPLSVVRGRLQRFPISLERGWNYVALPLEPVVSYTAESLCDEINSQGATVAEIDRFINGGWDGHICDLPFNDFPLELGSGYFIRSNTAISFSIEGLPMTTTMPFNIQEGWNSISLPHTDTYTAQSLCDELISQGVMAAEIDRWHDGGWKGHLCGLPFNDFPIERGTSYFVKSSSSGTAIASLRSR